MSDLISKDEVFDILRYLDVNFANSFDWHTLNEVRKLVEELPSVENKEKWIPISSIDEIPKEGAYWATFCYRGRPWVDLISWDSDREYWCDSERWYMDKTDQELITAYMPYFTPEPYKEAYSYDLARMFDGVSEIPKDAFKGWTTEELLGHKKDSHKEWWDSFYKGEVKPDE